LRTGRLRGDAGRQRVVAGYNEDDCRATLALRDWLESRRREPAERLGEEVPRLVVVEAPQAAEDPEIIRIRAGPGRSAANPAPRTSAASRCDHPPIL
jgi:hypothetical protein